MMVMCGLACSFNLKLIVNFILVISGKQCKSTSSESQADIWSGKCWISTIGNCSATD